MWFLVIDAPPSMKLRLDSGWVSPSYGVKTQTTIILVETTADIPVELVSIFADQLLNAEARSEYSSLLMRLQ
jgi:hypothetical protein